MPRKILELTRLKKVKEQGQQRLKYYNDIANKNRELITGQQIMAKKTTQKSLKLNNKLARNDKKPAPKTKNKTHLFKPMAETTKKLSHHDLLFNQKKSRLNTQRHTECQAYRKRMTDQKLANKNNLEKHQTTINKLRNIRDKLEKQKRQDYQILKERINKTMKKETLPLQEDNNNVMQNQQLQDNEIEIKKRIQTLKERIISLGKISQSQLGNKDTEEKIQNQQLQTEQKIQEPSNVVKEEMLSLEQKEKSIEKSAFNTKNIKVASYSQVNKLISKPQNNTINLKPEKRKKISNKTDEKDIPIVVVEKKINTDSLKNDNNLESLKKAKLQKNYNDKQFFEDSIKELMKNVNDASAMINEIETSKKNHTENMTKKVSQDDQQIPSKQQKKNQNTLKNVAKSIKTAVANNNQRNNSQQNRKTNDNNKKIRKAMQKEKSTYIKDPNDKTSEQKMQSYNLSKKDKKKMWKQNKAQASKVEKDKNITNFRDFIAEQKQKQKQNKAGENSCNLFEVITDKQNNQATIKSNVSLTTTSVTNEQNQQIPS